MWKSLFFKLPIPKNFGLAIASICFAVIGHFQLNGYAIAHWRLSHEIGSLKEQMVTIELELIEDSSQEKQKQTWALVKQKIRDSLNNLDTQHNRIMEVLSLYHIYGALSILFALWALRTGPVVLGIVTIPFALYGIYLVVTIM
jgi:Flp pilus assembly protein TadB